MKANLLCFTGLCWKEVKAVEFFVSKNLLATSVLGSSWFACCSRFIYRATQASGRRRRMPDLNSQSKQDSTHRQNPRQQHGRRSRWIGFEYVGNECNNFLQPTMLVPLGSRSLQLTQLMLCPKFSILGSWWTYTDACDKIKFCSSTC